ncbi:sulfatase-like hydrolase/transferase [Paraglaciecola aquimarina]|uniref:Sulfatase-like hydrolase/transferase n=1 Tax=Paraglaciecola aquimarina TaxID=1235557 RepID=A0ABU3T259_9ALTE|nr:sulfatase-like hydrolase/transferase [Paraglaciecola aquimarina]MDU0356312.1 sulfatase-like hydrolase/transferase [Paraglaciecola aquimarina]
MKKLSMKKMCMLSTLLVTTFGATIAMANEGQAKHAERPNILVILTDDMGYADVGFNGSQDIKTPNLDQLAAEGTTFSSAYNVHPFCGPSRAGLLTGRYPHKFGSQFNLPRSSRSGGLGIPVEETYMSKVLQDSGYYTGAIGKWHLGEEAQYHPNNRGFDEFYGFLNGGHDYFPDKFSKQYNSQRKQGLDHAIFGYLRPLEHNGKEVEETEYVTDGLSREAVNFIEAAAEDKSTPFFLYLAYNAPHSPMQAKAEDMAQFPNIKDKKRKTYAGMVYAVDRGVKRIVDSLKATGQFENTLIVFFSDNGGKPNLGADNGPLRGRKGDVLEGGYRTPMFFHWPNKVPVGRKFNHPISTLDLFPTFSHLANAKVPKSKKLDGKDILPSIQAGTNPRAGEMIYAVRHRLGFSEAAARKDNWKIINRGELDNNNQWQLFDVDKDPSETKDLAEKHPLLVREMVAEMEAWSWTNIQPKWFHIHQEGTQWREQSMPRFHETFSLSTK